MLKNEAITKLAEIMNRKDMSKKESSRGNAIVLRKKEKECKKLEQELSRVRFAGRSRPGKGTLYHITSEVSYFEE